MASLVLLLLLLRKGLGYTGTATPEDLSGAPLCVTDISDDDDDDSIYAERTPYAKVRAAKKEKERGLFRVMLA